MKLLTPFLVLALALVPCLAQTWDPGVKDGKTHPHAPIEVRPLEPRTFILRENLCDTWEAPFMYLLVGNRRALLIDTGDVADATAMPLAATVTGLLPKDLPLLVVHSHGHLDHRRGDGQFQGRPGVELVPSDLEHVRAFFGFQDWPQGRAEVDLGDRIIDVLPAPGHHKAEVLFYDRTTGTLFSGDFLLPGRLLVSEYDAYLASAERAAAFAQTHPITQVLGGHIEKNRAGDLYEWEAPYHPDEHDLALTRADVLALPAALRTFNGFYTQTGPFVLENGVHDLIAGGVALLLVLAGLGYGAYRLFRRWRRRRQ